MADMQLAQSSATRRDFIKLPAVAAVGAATSSVAESAHATGNETIRVGLIGCGGRGTAAAEEVLTARPSVKLVAMCDVFKDKIEASRQQIRTKHAEQVAVDDDHCFAGLRHKDAIEASDVVLIACASKFHPYYAQAAIQAGKHVFVEKPHGIDSAGVKTMKAVCELAKSKNLSIVSGLHSRWHKGWQETIQRIHDGAIGDIIAIQAMFLRPPYGLVQRPEGMSELLYHFRNWYHFCWLSGDDVPQSLVHNIDRASWVLKEQQPKWAFGLAGRSASFGEQFGDMYDHHTVVYEYTSGTRVYAMCRTQANTFEQYTEAIMGTKGKCDLAQCLIEPKGGSAWKYEGQVPNPQQVEQSALIDAVRNGKPINSGYHMYDSTMITVLGQVACYTGKYTTLNEVWKSDFNYGPQPEDVTLEMQPPTAPASDGNYPLPKPGTTKLL